MEIFFAVVALFLLFGIVGDKDKNKSQNYTLAFVACVAAIVILNILKG